MDLSLARGLDYYTGIIFEARMAFGEVKSAVSGGGRYDKLLSTISGDSGAPMVGGSIGIDRLLALSFEKADFEK